MSKNALNITTQIIRRVNMATAVLNARLWKAVKKHPLPQYRIAVNCGMSPSAFSAILQGGMLPTDEQEIAIENYL